jgi:hypothetical protein
MVLRNAGRIPGKRDDETRLYAQYVPRRYRLGRLLLGT